MIPAGVRPLLKTVLPPKPVAAATPGGTIDLMAGDEGGDGEDTYFLCPK